MPLGQAIGRLGCLAAGCCYGRPTDSWLGMYLPGDRGVRAVRYPTQPMSGAAVVPPRTWAHLASLAGLSLVSALLAANFAGTIRRAGTARTRRL